MIAGIFHEGSGLGNQLFRYITVRTLAEDKGHRWAMLNNNNFKGNFFTDIELRSPPFGYKDVLPVWNEKKITEKDIDVRGYDPEINFIEDETIVDGEFQDDKYWRHKLPEIDKWLAVEPLDVPDDVCVIGFRGGEYYSDPNLGLPYEYFRDAMERMRQINPQMCFEIHTDDPDMALALFKNEKQTAVIENSRISHSNHSNMGLNWRAMRYAKYAIIANSSFYIIPRILRKGITIAPRYWARRNTGVWALPSNYYPEFTYI